MSHKITKIKPVYKYSKSKQQIIDWCNKMLSLKQDNMDTSFLSSIIALANGEKLPLDYFCSKCSKYFVSDEIERHDDLNGFAVDYVRCPICNKEIKAGYCYY